MEDRKTWWARLPRPVLIMLLENKDMLVSALCARIMELEEKLKEAGIE